MNQILEPIGGVQGLCNIVAVLLFPIIALLVGQILQKRAEQHRDKMNVFRSVMSFRYCFTSDAVHALNSIPVVFAKDTKVCKSWKDYYKTLCIQEANAQQIKDRDNALYKLLQTMAVSLGYEKYVTWEEIQNPYYPDFMKTTKENNMKIQSNMSALLENAKSNITKPRNNNTGRNKNRR